MNPKLGLLLGMALGLTLACGPREERNEAARQRYEEALAIQDASSALEALEELRAGLPDTPESTLEIARRMGRAGEMNQALWLLEEALRRHPERTDLRLALAETALVVGSADQALRALEPIPPDDSRHPAALMLRHRAQLGLGDLEGALETLQVAEGLYPARIDFRANRVAVLVSEKQFARALELVREAKTRENLADEPRAWLDLTEADLLAAQGENEAALRALEPLTTGRSGEPGSGDLPDAAAWQRRATILIHLGRAQAACDELEQAIEAWPEAEDLYPPLASAQLARGDADAAEAVLRSRVERVPTPEAAEALAQHLHRTGRSSEGAAVLAEALERDPGADALELGYLHVAMLLTAGEREAAREHFAVFRSRNPQHPLTDYLRARFELADGEDAAAARRLKQVVSRMDRADVQHWLGVALERLGDDEGAELRYGLAISKNPGQVSSYYGLLRTLERRGTWRQVEEFAKRLLRVAPASTAGYESLTRALIGRGAPDEAEKVTRAFVQRFPALVAPRIALSETLRRQGRAQEALAMLDEAPPRFWSEPRFVAERAIVLGILGRSDEGLSAVARALADDEASPALHRARAYLLFSSGEGEAALEEAERALELAPHDPAPLEMTGDYLSLRGDFVGAGRAYERYLALRPRDAGVLFRLGVARVALGDVEGAIEAYRRAAEVDDKAVAPRNNLALLLAEQGRLDEALEAAQAAYARAESRPVVMDTLGWLYVRKGMPERGAALLEKARRLDPEAVEVRYHLALAYREAGRVAEARALLNELHEETDASHELYARIGEAVAALP